MNDSTKFAIQVLLTLALGVVVAVLVTYLAALVVGAFGVYNANEWPATGNLISGVTFGLVVGYRFSTLNAGSRKKK